MASAAPKLRIPTPRILVVSIAVFILLSGVSAVPIEPRRCYWCGPLADQVHRSVRAPSCEETQERVTTCEPGFTHCATVAITPSQSEEIRNLLNYRSSGAYIESRLCVKFYEEECYSVYCAATKIFSMICPCLNDLCNGPNTQREKKAFAILTELAKNRKKRALIASSSFKSMENISAIINVKNHNDSADDIQADQPIHENNEYDYQNESNALNFFKQDAVNTSIENDMSEIEENDENKTDLQTTTENVKETEELLAVTEHSVKLTSVENDEPSIVQNNVLPSAQLPPAEALQQNVTPTDKITEQASIDTTIASTHDTHAGVTLEPNETSKKNNGSRFNLHVFVLIIFVVMQHYI